MHKVISAGGVVFRRKNNKNEIAFIKDSYGKYALPKGHVEKGERLIEAAKREVIEEMGCKNVQVLGYLGNIKYIFKDIFGRETGKNELVKKEVHYFLMKMFHSARCVPQKEEGIEEIIWVPPENINHLSQYRNNAPVLKKAIKQIKNIP
jgi:ADP-ribose pyrophosphatase YjhB (NUDIX family)